MLSVGCKSSLYIRLNSCHKKDLINRAWSVHVIKLYTIIFFNFCHYFRLTQVHLFIWHLNGMQPTALQQIVSLFSYFFPTFICSCYRSRYSKVCICYVIVRKLSEKALHYAVWASSSHFGRASSTPGGQSVNSDVCLPIYLFSLSFFSICFVSFFVLF